MAGRGGPGLHAAIWLRQPSDTDELWMSVKNATPKNPQPNLAVVIPES